VTKPLKKKEEIVSPMAPPRSKGSARASSPLAQRNQALASYKKLMEASNAASGGAGGASKSNSGSDKSNSGGDGLADQLALIQERQLLRLQKKQQAEV
jgi:hypothetical protein